MRSPLLSQAAVLLAALALGCVAAHPPRLAAQTCVSCGTEGPPSVEVEPASGSWTAMPATMTQAVSITFCADGSLAPTPGSETITLDGSAAAGFTDGPVSGSCFTASGSVTLTHGTHTLAARITTGGGTGTASATYAYTAPPPTYMMSLTPKAQAVSRTIGYQRTETFTLTNSGNTDATYLLRAGCAGAAGTCSLTQASVSIPAGASSIVGVNYWPAGPQGATGTVSLAAWNRDVTSARDSAAYTVTAQTAPWSGVPGMRPDMTRLDRGVCVTLAAAPGAAFECGDLRLAHPLPAVRLLGRTRAPALIYNSGHASPFVTVAPLVQPVTGSRPDTVRASLLVNGAAYTAKWPGWPSDTAKKIAVGFDAGAMPTGVYAYNLTVTGTFNNGSPAQTIYTAGGDLVVVNRRSSPFGAGWWLAGVEQLVAASGNRWLWIGGDGSHHLYAPVAGSTTAWVADTYDRADTLTLVSGEYVRRLPGKVEVHFDLSGHHVSTVNARGQKTQFAWSGSALARVDLPLAGYSYLFTYGNDGGTRLSTVTSPGAAAARTTTVHTAADGSGRVTSIVDPDGHTVAFSYPSSDFRVEKRTAQNGYTARFGYGESSLLTLAKVPTSATDTITTTYRAAEGQGLLAAAASISTVVTGPRPGVVTTFVEDKYGAVVRVTDAAGQSTNVYRTEIGFPALASRVDYPNGRTVTASYDGAGHLTATTDESSSSGGRYATTLFAWDPACELPVSTVLPEGETTTRSYNSFCEPDWIQPGPDPARRVRFTYRALTNATAPGEVAATILPQLPGEPSAPVETYEYDARGNPSAVVSPLGIRSESYSDAIGRDTLDRVSIDYRWQLARHVYDVMGRDTMDETIGPAMSSHPEQHLVVRSVYDSISGLLLRVERKSLPDTARVATIRTQWTYDGAMRKVSETAIDGYTETYTLDPAGNVTAVTTRRGRHISMTYDVMNRLTQRITDTVQYARDSASVYMVTGGAYVGSWGWPHYPNTSGGGLLIPADTVSFTSDAATGAMLSADDHDARVRRGYYPNGALKTDSTYIRTWAELSAGGSFTQHAYGIQYTYDLDGRVIQLQHPANLAPVNGNTGQVYATQAFGYDPGTGALAQVTSVLGLGYGFHYNLQGQLDSTSYPGGTGEKLTYDLDGRLATRVLAGPNYNGSTTAIHNLSWTYDNRGKALTVDDGGLAGAGSVTLAYTGLGMMASADGQFGPNTTGLVYEHYAYDALGNRVAETEGVQQSTTNYADFEGGTGRLISTHAPAGVAYANGNVPPADRSWYDHSGNLIVYQLDNHAGKMISRTRNYYDAEERLRVSERWSCNVQTDAVFSYSNIQGSCEPKYQLDNSNAGAYEEYRYDALGRRILVRTRRDPYCTSASCAGTLVRTLWAGDQVLYEMRAKGGDDATAANLENDGEQGAYYGRVAYTHGAGIDQPLDVIRIGYTLQPTNTSVDYGFGNWGGPYPVIPFTNWHGSIDAATTALGQRMPCQSECTVNLHLPGNEYQMYFAPSKLIARQSWFGSLIESKADGTGQMYMRNRYYNPATGTFTQEDPIGIAGGLNVYGFANGDPVTYSDPFGLKVCANSPGLKQAISDAFQMKIKWAGDCVSSARAVEGSAAYSELQDQFTQMVEADNTWTIRWGPRGSGSHHSNNLTSDADQYEVSIDPADIGKRYETVGRGYCGKLYGPVGTFSLYSLIVHELIGHGGGVIRNASRFPSWQQGAIEWENKYYAAAPGYQPERCY